MQIDIKTSVIQPKRQTFANLARRFGEDRPASRYEEGTLELQADANFHYRPLWEPEMEIFDKRRSQITMEDWYALKDPRQYYYANYNIARAKQYEGVDQNFEMVEKRGMLNAVPADWMEKIKTYMLPLRHYAWGANMNNCQVTVFAWGTALTAATCFAMADNLAVAQLIGRIGLAVDEGREGALNAARDAWVNDAMWQGMRHMVEDSLVVKDPIELLVAQNLAMDGIVMPLVFGTFAAEGDRRGAAAMSFLCQFINEWRDEFGRWVDSVIKTMAAENASNKQLLTGWFRTWSRRAAEAMTPVAIHVLGAEAGKAAIAEATAQLDARAAKLGLA